MGSLNEYAKLVKVKSDFVKGFQAKITLPSGFELGDWDYINFYCGVGPFECGLSARNSADFKQNGVIKWRWFANTQDGPPLHGPEFYSNGETHQILLARDQNDKVVFRVDGADKYVSAKKFTEYGGDLTNQGRLIIACCQSSPLTNPLPAFRVKHNQVRAFEMQYKNDAGAWVRMTTPSKVTLEHWPTNITPPAPVDYTNVDTSYMGNADLYASMKF